MSTLVRSVAGAAWMVMAYPLSTWGPTSGATRTSAQVPSVVCSWVCAVWSGCAGLARRARMA